MNTFLCYLFILISVTSAPAQIVDWVSHGGGGNSDFGEAIATDQDGNVFLAASFMGNATYNSITLNGIRFSNFFVAKHNPERNLIWIRQLTAANIYGIDTDQYGNCYISGSCGNATFYDPKPYQVHQQGGGDLFIAKYSVYLVVAQDGVRSYSKKVVVR